MARLTAIAAGLINVSPIMCGFTCAIKYATSYDALWASAGIVGIGIFRRNNLMGQQRKRKKLTEMFLLHGFILISTHIYVYIYTIMG